MIGGFTGRKRNKNVLRYFFFVFFFFSILLLIFPAHAVAWGPGIHTLITSSIDLHSIGNSISKICLKFYPQFLWGSLLADVVIGKNFTRWQYHPHNWEFILSIFEEAENDMCRAFMAGYMTHLAQDIIAHNFLVPEFTLLEAFVKPNSKVRTNLVHFKIESNAEKIPKEDIWKKIRYLQKLPENKECMHFLEDKLKAPPFSSVRTSRKIYIRALTLKGLQALIKSKFEKKAKKERKNQNRIDSIHISEIKNQKKINSEESAILIYVKEAYKVSSEFIREFDRSKLIEFDPTGIEVIYISESLANAVKKIAGKKGDEAGSPEKYFSVLRMFQPPLMGKRTPVLFILKES